MAMSFLGTQPLSTHVPPVPPLSSLEMKSRGSSHSATFAPARTFGAHGQPSVREPCCRKHLSLTESAAPWKAQHGPGV